MIDQRGFAYAASRDKGHDVRRWIGPSVVEPLQFLFRDQTDRQLRQAGDGEGLRDWGSGLWIAGCVIIESEGLALSARLEPRFADLTWLDARLTEKKTVERFVTALFRHLIMIQSSQRFRDKLLLIRRKQDRHEFL